MQSKQGRLFYGFSKIKVCPRCLKARAKMDQILWMFLLSIKLRNSFFLFLSRSSQATNGLKIVQSNLQHCRLANATLQQFFSKKNLEIALIQEPYLHNKRIVGLAKTKGALFTDWSSPRPRTCILVKKNDNCTEVAL